MDEGFLSITPNEVELKPYTPRPIKPVQYLSDAELLANVGGIAFVDTEKYSNYFLIAFKINGKYLPLELPFNVQKLSWIMHNYRTVGFNTIKYDNLMIWCSFAYQDLNKLQDLSDAIIFENLYTKQAQIDFGFKVFPTSIIDLIEVCPLRGSLKLYGARLHSLRIQELPYPIQKPLSEEQKNYVKHYCFNDLDVTELIYNNLTEQLALRENLSAQYHTDIMSKSDAQIAETVIGNELKKLTGYWPKKPDISSDTFSHKFQIPSNMHFQTPYLQKILHQISEISFTVGEGGRLERSAMNDIHIQLGNSIYRMGIGGLHSSEECRALKSDKDNILIDKDVASYYPAILINLGLHPTHLNQKLFSEIYSKIRDRRIEAKKSKNIVTSDSLKIVLNSTFGKTGSPYSFLYAPEMTVQITICGQLYLLMLIEQLELNSIPIVSANTDGILIYCPQTKRAKMNELFKAWEELTGFVTEETIFSHVFSRDCNNYIAILAEI